MDRKRQLKWYVLLQIKLPLHNLKAKWYGIAIANFSSAFILKWEEAIISIVTSKHYEVAVEALSLMIFLVQINAQKGLSLEPFNIWRIMTAAMATKIWNINSKMINKEFFPNANLYFPELFLQSSS